MRNIKYHPELLKEFATKLSCVSEASQGSTKEQENKVVEPKVSDKTKFDIEITAIDASKKLTIIKEYKNSLGLGLKEAKETIESLPFVMKKAVDKVEAEELKQKYKLIGCTVNLK